jgi:hypothetical protein
VRTPRDRALQAEPERRHSKGDAGHRENVESCERERADTAAEAATAATAVLDAATVGAHRNVLVLIARRAGRLSPGEPRCDQGREHSADQRCGEHLP